MRTIEEMQSKVTVFYRRADGSIKLTLDGIHDMSIFGDEKEDYVLIWGYSVIDTSQIPCDFQLLKVNTKTLDLELKVGVISE